MPPSERPIDAAGMEAALANAPVCEHDHRNKIMKDRNGRGLCVECAIRALGLPWPPKRKKI